VPELRAQIARDLARRNIAVDPQDILVTTGSQQGLDLATRLLVDPGERFLVEQATYAGAINLLSAAGAQIVPVPTDEVGPDLDALDAIGKGGAKGFYLMPSCQNPTGATLPRERREALLRWSERSRVPLIEDDYGADLDLEGNGEPIALRALSGDVLHLGSYSKRLVPALRVGYLVAPRTLVPRLVGLKHAMDLGTSALLQHVLAEFLDRGYLVAHLEHSLPEYRRRRDAVAEVLQHHLPQGVRWSWPHRGLLFWLELPPEVAAEDIHEESRKRGVLVTPGTLNSAGATVRQGVRITFCAEPVERLEEGVRRLCAATAAVMSRRSHSLSSQPSYLSGA
jgi:DNA-binding transcriptional MocR family regulator